jgi:hypothetical protein
MQSPMLIFDHVAKTVATVGPADPKLAAVIEAQRHVVTSAHGTPKSQ